MFRQTTNEYTQLVSTHPLSFWRYLCAQILSAIRNVPFRLSERLSVLDLDAIVQRMHLKCSINHSIVHQNTSTHFLFTLTSQTTPVHKNHVTRQTAQCMKRTQVILGPTMVSRKNFYVPWVRLFSVYTLNYIQVYSHGPNVIRRPAILIVYQHHFCIIVRCHESVVYYMCVRL